MQTGIQRVTRNIAGELAKITDEARWSVLGQDMQFYELTSLPQPTDPAFSHVENRLSFGDGDIYFVLDCTWDLKILERLLPYKLNGLTAGVMFYDLIPITHPQYSVVAGDFFKTWIRESFRYSDFFACISRATADELKRSAVYLQSRRGLDDDAVFSFPLGADFTTREPNYSPQNKMLEKAFEGGNTYLMVSTLEPRKNHALLLDAFEEVWDATPDAKLCLIGRAVWLMKDFAKQLSEHRMKDKRLFWFENNSDADVAWAYEHSKCVVYTSIAEGFGLPIIEALHYGKPVIASDIPVLHEVAGDRAVYFDPLDKTALAEAIKRVAENQAGLAAMLENFKWPSWRECARILLDKITKCDARIREEREKKRGQHRGILKFPAGLDARGIANAAHDILVGGTQGFPMPDTQSPGPVENPNVFEPLVAEYQNAIAKIDRLECANRRKSKTRDKIAGAWEKLFETMRSRFCDSARETQHEHDCELNAFIASLLAEIVNLKKMRDDSEKVR
jgi:alpha-1,2-rhamnosyltransferase